MKLTPCTTQEALWTPFPKDLDPLFLEEDAVFAEFAVEDTTTVKHNSALIEDTEWSTFVKDTRALAANIGRPLSSLGIGSQGSDKGSQVDISVASVLVEEKSSHRRRQIHGSDETTNPRAQAIGISTLSVKSCIGQTILVREKLFGTAIRSLTIESMSGLDRIEGYKACNDPRTQEDV